jgi:hypothetical protein
VFKPIDIVVFAQRLVALQRVADVGGARIVFSGNDWETDTTADVHVDASCRVIAALPCVAVSMDVTTQNPNGFPEKWRHYKLVATHATEIQVSMKYYTMEFDNYMALHMESRVRQVVVAHLVVTDILSQHILYNRWHRLLQALRLHNVYRIVLDMSKDYGSFVRLPESLVLVDEAYKAGITIVLRKTVHDRLTRACALRMSRAPGIEIEDEAMAFDSDIQIANRDADLDMARLGTPGMLAAWAHYKHKLDNQSQ